MNKALRSRDFEIRLRRDRDMINDRIDELLAPPSEAPVSLHEAMRYATLGGGKRLRGILCLAVHRLFGDPCPGAALDSACSIELLHAYTLIHDDLPALDDDDMRRAQPSCHIKFGEAVAILAGDALQALAFEVLAGCRADESRVIDAGGMLSRVAGSRFLVGGQVADLEGEGKESTADRVSFIHSRKTAQLIAVSMAIGAVIAGAEKSDCLEILEIGKKVGFAFQIVDDILDIDGNEEVVGKVLRKDSKRGKITHPACFGPTRSREVAGELIDDAAKRIKELDDRGYLKELFELIVERVS